ncbi:MAG TPA: hypothetical protein VLG72_00785 [Nitrospirota bacterium]|nr:hypothetical protein [Nitrospirota bacterium]
MAGGFEPKQAQQRGQRERRDTPGFGTAGTRLPAVSKCQTCLNRREGMGPD